MNVLKEEGFTLVEILVVLTVLGFMAAMAAPRLAGMTSSSADTADSMSARKLHELVTLYNGKYGKYPDNCINEVTVDLSTGLYSAPMVSDLDPENGPEVLSHSYSSRCRLHLHYLNAAEVEELRKAGIVHILNLNSPYDRDIAVKAASLDPVEILAGSGMAVLMTGGGDSDNDGTIETSEVDLSEPDWSFPGVQFRIVMGIGFDNGLVKEGFAFNPGYCANSSTEPVDGSFRAYSILLPRLSATSARLKADMPYGAPAGPSGTVTFHRIAGTADAMALQNSQQRTEDIYAAQNPAFFDIVCSEGVRFHPGAGPKEIWGADFNGNGAID